MARPDKRAPKSLHTRRMRRRAAADLTTARPRRTVLGERRLAEECLDLGVEVGVGGDTETGAEGEPLQPALALHVEEDRCVAGEVAQDRRELAHDPRRSAPRIDA